MPHLGTVPLVLLSAALLGCASTAPPRSARLEHQPSVSENRRVMLMVDVCLSQSPLASTDYFLTAPSLAGATELTAGIERFLSASGIQLAERITPFVCGALHDADNKPKRVAESIDGTISEVPQPFWLSPDLRGDPSYVDALQALSTHLFESALARFSNTASPTLSRTVSPDRATRAAGLVAQRTNIDTLMYVGVTGTSLSSAKTAAVRTLQVLGGVATSLAVGPIASSRGNQVYSVFVPGGPGDARQMVATTMNLRSGQVLFTSVVSAGGDPLKAEVIAHPTAISLLLRDLTFRTVPR